MRRTLFIAAAAGLGLSALSLSAKADIVKFDADGGAAANGSVNIQGIDFLPGNTLIKNANPLAQSPAVDLYNQYYQAKAGSLLGPGNSNIVPNGLNSAFELTVVAGFTTVGTGGTDFFGNPVQAYQLAGSRFQTLNFFEIWYDPTPDADNLGGTGFNGGDSVLVLSGNVTSANARFTDTDPGNYQAFDQSGSNDYPGVWSISGTGSLRLQAAVSYSNPAFFTDNLKVIDLLTSTTDNSLPFIVVDPSHQFADGGIGSSNGSLINANVGTINGGPQNGIHDLQLQADANVSFVTSSIPVPLPSSAVAGGATMLLLGGIGALRKARRSRD